MTEFYTQAARPATHPQMDLFADPGRWPKKPYCSEDLTCTRIRSLVHALKHPYIQANPPHLRVWSIYDIDRAGGGLAWEENNLPPPAWATINKENGHAHLVWGLRAPVLVEAADARRAPMRYLAAVESAFREKLQADQGYAGLLTKNPSHPLWWTLRGPDSAQFYDLADLAEWVDLPRHMPKQGVNPEQIGLGRNCILFDWLRQWAYKGVRKFRGERVTPWKNAVLERAQARNADFPMPLSTQEVGHIAKSVAKWVWARDAMAEQSFLKRQQWKGEQSGKARLAKSEDKRSSARLMRSVGLSSRAIAEQLQVNQSTVIRWLHSGDA